jgi:alkylation response protein AidB-like acyl-CoA dehydrogenase
MKHYTRLDFAVGSAGVMRWQAAHHTTWRRAFQKALIDQPLMTNLIADLAVEVEAAAWLAFHFVHALDQEGRPGFGVAIPSRPFFEIQYSLPPASVSIATPVRRA